MSTPTTRASRVNSSTPRKSRATVTSAVAAPPLPHALCVSTTTQPARQPSTPATRSATPTPSGAPGRLAGDECVVDHGHERDDVEHGPAGLTLDVGGIRRHVRALEHDRRDVRVLGDEPTRDTHVFLAREVRSEEHTSELQSP